ncbi:MAG: FAD:protein FMN transferase [Xanthomonadales bacterium]
MMRLPVIAVLLLATLLTVGCREEPTSRQAEFYVFGTLTGVTLWDVDEAQADRAFARLQETFRRMHRDWHAWEPGELTRINAAFARGEAITASEDIVELVRRSQELERLTGGRFNPAIGALIRLWGFHTSEYPIIGPPPDRSDVEALLAKQPSTRDIRIDGLRLESSNPAVQLDFGAVAKGYAIDIACAQLRELGIDNAIVNAGGDLRVIGSHGDRPWRIAVRAPGGGIVGSLETGRDEAIFTSGNYERFRQEETRRYPHILDPRNGWPVEDLASVTVIASEGLLADAAATALIVAGRSGWRDVAQSLGLDQVLMIDAAGKVYQTERMAGRIELLDGIESEIVD